MSLQIKSLDEYKKTYQKSVEDPEGFWAEQAESFVWQKKWDKVLDWNFKEPNVNWFVGGKLNITENCLEKITKSLIFTGLRSNESFNSKLSVLSTTDKTS